MSLEDLKLILGKDPIIATYPVSFLKDKPAQVEREYGVHARTHIPLGDTTNYVDSIIRWVTGVNKGAFIGAVIGDYGHGKTSFQVHVWEQSQKAGVLAVPPFEWYSVADIADGTNAWVQYVLEKTHPAAARRAGELHKNTVLDAIQDLAARIAQSTGQLIEDVMAVVQKAQNLASLDLRLSPEKLLEYFNRLVPILKECGYKGLLVLLDEPEEAMKTLGVNETCQLLFGIANGILQRQEDYGVFVSIPENFLATIQRNFASLAARLDGRHCMPRLRDLYGVDFPKNLWERYMEYFAVPVPSDAIVMPATLEAIGQVASSDRRDLSYGPRTAVSALSRMVSGYLDKDEAYSVLDFVSDCLSSEIMVTPDYRTKVRETLESPESRGFKETDILTLCGFPNGLSLEAAEHLGITKDVLESLRKSGVVNRTASLYGIRVLSKDDGPREIDELRESIEDVFESYAPSPKSFASARTAFIEHVISVLFEKRQGQQLVGWEKCSDWMKTATGLSLAEYRGAFRQTEREFPRRLFTVAVGEAGVPLKLLDRPSEESRERDPEVVVHFSLRWSQDKKHEERRVNINEGDPAARRPGCIRMSLDLLGGPLALPNLDEISPATHDFSRTPLAILYLIGEMDKIKLSHTFEMQWAILRDQLIREIVISLLGDQAIRSQASEYLKGVLPAGVAELLGILSLNILRRRYQGYTTLMRQPQWEKKVQDYINALKNQTIPVAARRGREPWVASKNEVAKALNSNPMNLGDSFAGYESIINIDTTGTKHDPATVHFKVHPMEQAVADYIVRDCPDRRKINNKECWWARLASIYDLLAKSGYVGDEAARLLEIGQSRGLFAICSYNGSFIVYCAPVDPEQMKAQLRDKLDEMTLQTQELKKLPQYRPTVDIDAIAGEINRLQDDVDFDKLMSKFERQFEENLDQVSLYSDKLCHLLSEVAAYIEKDKKALSPQKRASLQANPTGISPWGSDLMKYILPNLRTAFRNCEQACDKLYREANQASVRYRTTVGTFTERVVLIQDGYGVYAAQANRLKDLRNEISVVITRVDDYEQWKMLLKQSDELYSSLFDLRKDGPAYRTADELIAEFENVSRSISEHLSLKNVSGLGSYNQFRARFNEIEQKRRTHISGLKTAFEQEKTRINNLMKDMDLAGGPHVAEPFDPSDSKGSYERLHGRAVELIRSSLETELKDLATQAMEVVYSKAVLKRLEETVAHDIATAIEKAEEKMRGLMESITPEFFGTKDVETNIIKTEIQTARSICKDARQAVRAAQAGTDAELSEASRKMLSLLPKGSAVDLKQIILSLMESQEESSDVLGGALESLSELFRHNRVQIKVEMTAR